MENVPTIGGTARVAAIIGWPVTHSRSPRLHGYWLKQYRVDGAYVPLGVRPEHAVEALRALAWLGFVGANVTAPHKEAALAAVDSVDATARRIGAVNTLVVKENGELHGFNTDGYGFLENLRHELPGWRSDAGPATVLGAGGAARAVIAALVGAGAPEVRLVNRTVKRAQELAADWGGPVRVQRWETRHAALAGAALLVNTTTLGMEGEPPLDLDLASLPPEAVVSDIVYTPLDTALLRAARTRGNRVVDGLGMLLHQGRPGFRAWFGVDPAVSPELRAFVMNGRGR